jgi:hypothetical protein
MGPCPKVGTDPDRALTPIALGPTGAPSFFGGQSALREWGGQLLGSALREFVIDGKKFVPTGSLATAPLRFGGPVQSCAL